MDALTDRLFWLGIFAAIAKLLGFTESSWSLVLVPIYLPFVLAFGIMLLSIPILLLLGWPVEKSKRPSNRRQKIRMLLPANFVLLQIRQVTNNTQTAGHRQLPLNDIIGHLLIEVLRNSLL